MLPCLVFGLLTSTDLACRPQLSVVNGSRQPVVVHWIPEGGDPVPIDTVPPLESRRIRTHLGHQFVLVGQHDLREVAVESMVLHQAVRFDPPDPHGVPSMYTQRLDAGGFPIVASTNVNPYALE